MTGTNCDLFTHKSSRSYLNHLVFPRKIFWLTAEIVKFVTVSWRFQCVVTPYIFGVGLHTENVHEQESGKICVRS